MVKDVIQAKEKSREHFDGVAGHYDASYAGKHSRTMYEGVLQNISMFPHNTILDVGCGTGNLLSTIPRETATRLYGVDLSPEMVRLAGQKLGPDAEIKVGDSEDLPWPVSSFDIVCCTDSFHHYPRPEKVLQEMKRVLKPGGHLIIGDPWAPVPFRQTANVKALAGRSRRLPLVSG